jgi:hypothetical protein
VNPNIASEYVEKGATDDLKRALRPELIEEAHKRVGQYDRFTPDIDTDLGKKDFLDYINRRLPGGSIGEGDKGLETVLDDLLETSGNLAPRNVRRQFLDIRNPFDIERQYAGRDVEPIFRKALSDPVSPSGQLPDYFWPDQNYSGEDVYSQLVNILGEDKAAASQALRSAGYDAIQHVGGGRMGDMGHQVHIAFDPKQVYQPLVVGGPRRIPSMSPLLAGLGLHNIGASSY